MGNGSLEKSPYIIPNNRLASASGTHPDRAWGTNLKARRGFMPKVIRNDARLAPGALRKLQGQGLLADRAFRCHLRVLFPLTTL